MTILIFLVVITSVYGVITFNALTRLRQLTDNAWADIDVQLKRRHDLIPSLVATVKGHAGYERGTLDAVVEARNRAVNAGGPSAAGEAERVLASAVRQIFVLAEAYPELQAGESYLALQKNLTDIEDHIQNARRYYNAVVRDRNTKVQQFPSNLVAGLFRFQEAEFFGLTDRGEGTVPTIDLEGKP
jgi:LemA protein